MKPGTKVKVKQKTKQNKKHKQTKKGNSLTEGTRWLPNVPIDIPRLYGLKKFVLSVSQAGIIYKQTIHLLMHYKFYSPQIKNAKTL